MDREESSKKRKRIKKDQLVEEILDMKSKNSTNKELMESLEYLKISVKYLVFDLEATRREKEVLAREIKRLKGL